MTTSHEVLTRSRSVSDLHKAHKSNFDSIPADPIVPLTLRQLYYKYFYAISAQTQERREQAFALRYQVYCMERGFEAPNPANPGQEIDIHDSHSLHSLLIRRATGEVAGAVRLVLPCGGGEAGGLPFFTLCDDPLIRDPHRFPAHLFGEVSRFCISKKFRRRLNDRRYAEDTPELQNGIPADDARRLIPHLTLGLIEQLVRQSIDNGLQYWCAEMEPSLLRLLARLGIHFEPVGPLIDYHGLRQPCMLRLDKMLSTVKSERPDVWSILSDEGRHEDVLRPAI